jgi:tRNA nucleotidyltransferase (CCA-adding enzyme)
MMRGLRFVSQLDFSMEEDTAKAIKENAPLLEKISVERILVEFMKLMLGTSRSNALQMMLDLDVVNYIPEFKILTKVKKQALLSITNEKLTSSSEAWALLLLKVVVAEEDILPFLKSWKESNDVIKTTKKIFHALSFRLQHSWTNDELYLLSKVELRSVERLLPFFNGAQDVDAEKKYETLQIHSKKDLLVNGGELMKLLGKKPGPWLGELLDKIERAVVNNELKNSKEDIFNFVNEN